MDKTFSFLILSIMTCDPLIPLVSIIASESALVVDGRILYEYWSNFSLERLHSFMRLKDWENA